MKKSFKLIALLCVIAPAFFASCVNEAPEINYKVDYTHNSDFTGIIAALNSQTTKLEAKMDLLKKAIDDNTLTMSQKVEGFLMNDEGSSFDVTPAGGSATVPFRPYFVYTGSNAPSYDVTRSIHFDSSESSFTIDEDPSDELAGELRFSVKPRKLVTSSTLRKPADVQIYSTSGVVISSFTIQPGETVETDINTSGVYIVRAANGRYTKKLTLK